MDFLTAAYSDKGIKKNTNQDSLLIKTAQTDYGKVLLAVICDGMGGLAKGELASATLIRAFSDWFENELPEQLAYEVQLEGLKNSWNRLIYRINSKIADYADEIHTRMGTTAAALLIAGEQYYIVNVGDSRVYAVTDRMYQLTKDQTFIQREMDQGRMTWEEARRDPRRNVLLQCVGASSVIEPDYFTGQAFAGEVFMLCSDGFRHVIAEEEFLERMHPGALVDEQTMQETAVYFTELNMYRKEEDNISVALIKIV